VNGTSTGPACPPKQLRQGADDKTDKKAGEKRRIASEGGLDHDREKIDADDASDNHGCEILDVRQKAVSDIAEETHQLIVNTEDDGQYATRQSRQNRPDSDQHAF